MMSLLEARGLSGEASWLSNMFVSRFITYCAEELNDDAVGGKIIQRKPRSQSQLRAAVSPKRIARYFFRLFKLIDGKRFRWVSIIHAQRRSYSTQHTALSIKHTIHHTPHTAHRTQS